MTHRARPAVAAIPALPHERPVLDTIFGYLSMIESSDYGYFGGYLAVSALGRPLEFHCTAPVRPSRAQKILYGPTLEPFLLGEQIAGALLDVVKLAPSLMLANCEATLHARARTKVPMVLLCAESERSSVGADQTNPRDATQNASSTLGMAAAPRAEKYGILTVGAHDFQLPLGYESDRDEVIQLLGELSRQVDVAEPFSRIEEAIREAQRLGSRGTEIHDQAA